MPFKGNESLTVPLLGREGDFERNVLKRDKRIQEHANDVAGERRVQERQYTA